MFRILESHYGMNDTFMWKHKPNGTTYIMNGCQLFDYMHRMEVYDEFEIDKSVSKPIKKVHKKWKDAAKSGLLVDNFDPFLIIADNDADMFMFNLVENVDSITVDWSSFQEMIEDWIEITVNSDRTGDALRLVEFLVKSFDNLLLDLRPTDELHLNLTDATTQVLLFELIESGDFNEDNDCWRDLIVSPAVEEWLLTNYPIYWLINKIETSGIDDIKFDDLITLQLIYEYIDSQEQQRSITFIKIAFSLFCLVPEGSRDTAMTKINIVANTGQLSWILMNRQLITDKHQGAYTYFIQNVNVDQINIR